MKKLLAACFLLTSTGLFAQSTSTEVVTFAKGESLGSCRVVFTRESGEELVFWNPDLGSFADPADPCMISGLYQDTPFNVTWQVGSMQVYTTAGGNEVLETPILLNITTAP